MFKSILTDLKTRVESNIQEALRPIDNIGSQCIPDSETEFLKNRVKDLLEEVQQLAHKLALTEQKLRDTSLQPDHKNPEIYEEFLSYRVSSEKEISDLRQTLAARDQQISDSRNFHVSDWQLRYEAALQAVGELEEKLDESHDEISVLRQQLRHKFSFYFCVPLSIHVRK